MDIIIAIAFGALCVVAILGWMYFCYKNPGTASLIYLISMLTGE